MKNLEQNNFFRQNVVDINKIEEWTYYQTVMMFYKNLLDSGLMSRNEYCSKMVSMAGCMNLNESMEYLMNRPEYDAT